MTAKEIAAKWLGMPISNMGLTLLEEDIKTYAHNVAQEALNDAACAETYFNYIGEQKNHSIANTEIHTP